MGKKGTKRKTQWRTLSITESPPQNLKSALVKQFASEHNDVNSTSTIETNNVEEAVSQDDDCSNHRSFSTSLYLKRKSSASSNYRNDYRNNSSYSYSNKHNNNSTSSTSSLYSSSRYSSSYRRRPFSSLQNGSSRYSAYSTDRTSNREHRNTNTTNSRDIGNFTTTPLFNEEEYTRISTPRQDVIFKKGCFAQPKKYMSSTDTNTTSSAAASVVSAEESVSALSVPSLSPEQCSSIADSLDPEQGLFYSFVDQNGIVYSYVPNGYDQYNGQMIMLPYGYPPYMCSPDAISPTGSNEENEENEQKRTSVESPEITPSDLNETKVINEVPTDASSSKESSDETPNSQENADNKQCDEDIAVPNEITSQTVTANVVVSENQIAVETAECTTGSKSVETAEKTIETTAESTEATAKSIETDAELMQSPIESGFELGESAGISEVVPSIPDQFYNYGYAPYYTPQILYPYVIPQQFVPIYGNEYDIPAEEDYSDCIEDQNRIRYRNRKKRKSMDGNSTGVSATTTDYSEEDSEYGESHDPEEDEISSSDQNANMETKERLLETSGTETKPTTLNANVEEFVPRANIKSNLNVNVQEFLPSRYKDASSKALRGVSHGNKIQSNEKNIPNKSSTSVQPASFTVKIKSQLSPEKQAARKPSELTLAEKIKLNLAQESKHSERDNREPERSLTQRRNAKNNFTRKNLATQTKKGGARRKPELITNKKSLPSRPQPDVVSCSQPSYAQIANRGVNDNEQNVLIEGDNPSSSKQAVYTPVKNNSGNSDESHTAYKTPNKSTSSLSPLNAEPVITTDSTTAESWQTVKPRGKRSKHMKEQQSDEGHYEEERLEESPLQKEKNSKPTILLDSSKVESEKSAQAEVELDKAEEQPILEQSEALKEDTAESNNVAKTPVPATNKKTPKSKGRKGAKKTSITPVKIKRKNFELVEPVFQPLQKAGKLSSEDSQSLVSSGSDLESTKQTANETEFAYENDDATFGRVEPDFSFDRMYLGKGFARRPIDILKGFDYKFKSKSLLKEEEEMVLSVIKSINNTNSPSPPKMSPTTSFIEEDDSDDKTIVDNDKIDTGESGSDTETVSDVSINHCSESKIIEETDKVDIDQISESTKHGNEEKVKEETVQLEAVSPKDEDDIDKSVSSQAEEDLTDFENENNSNKVTEQQFIGMQETELQDYTSAEIGYGLGENEKNSMLDCNLSVTEEVLLGEPIISETTKSTVLKGFEVSGNLNMPTEVNGHINRSNESEMKSYDVSSTICNGEKYIELEFEETNNTSASDNLQIVPSIDGICLSSDLQVKDYFDKTGNAESTQLPPENFVACRSMNSICNIMQNTPVPTKPAEQHNNTIEADGLSMNSSENSWKHLNGDVKENEISSWCESKTIECGNASIGQLHAEKCIDDNNKSIATFNREGENITVLNGFLNGKVVESEKQDSYDCQEDTNTTNNTFIKKKLQNTLQHNNQDCEKNILSNGVNYGYDPTSHGLEIMPSETGDLEKNIHEDTSGSINGQINNDPYLSECLDKEPILSEDSYLQNNNIDDVSTNPDFTTNHKANSKTEIEKLSTKACDKHVNEDALRTLQPSNATLFKERLKSPFESKENLLEDLDDLYVSRPLGSRPEHGSSDYLSCVNALSTIIRSRECSMESDRSRCGSAEQKDYRESSLESQISRECSHEPGLSRKSSVDPEYAPSKDYLACVNILSNLIKSREGSIDPDSRSSSKAASGDALKNNSQILEQAVEELASEMSRKSTDLSSCFQTDSTVNLVDINQLSLHATDHVNLTQGTQHYATSELAESISDAMIFSELLSNSKVDFRSSEENGQKKSARVLNASISCDRSSGIGSDCEDNQPTSPNIIDGKCDPNTPSCSQPTAQSDEKTQCKPLFPINNIVSESVSPRPNKEMPNHVLPIISQTNSVNCDNQSVSYTSSKDLFDPGVDPGPCSSDASHDEDHLKISTRSKFPSRCDNESNLFPLTQAVRQWLAEESKEPTPERLFRIPDDPDVRSYLAKQIQSTSPVYDSEDWTCTDESGDDGDVSDDLKFENDAPEDLPKPNSKPKNLQSNPLHASFCNAITPESDSDYNSDSNEHHCTGRKDDNTCKRVAETESEMENSLPNKNDLLEYWDDEFLRNPNNRFTVAGAGSTKQMAKLNELQSRSTSANRDSTRSPSTDMEPYESVYGKTIDYNQLIACNYEFLSNNIISFNDNDAKSADAKSQEEIGTKPEENNDEKWKLLGSSNNFYNTIHRNTSANTATTRIADSHTNRKNDNCLKPPEVCCILM